MIKWQRKPKHKNLPLKFVLNYWPKRSSLDELDDPAYLFATLKSPLNVPNWVLNPIVEQNSD